MVDSEKQALQHGQTAKTSTKAHRHKAAFGSYACRTVVVVHRTEGDGGNHCTVAQHRVGVSGIEGGRYGYIVAAVPYIVGSYDGSRLKFRAIKIEIAVNYSHYHILVALGKVPRIVCLDSTEMPRLSGITQSCIVGLIAHIHYPFLKNKEGYVGYLLRKLCDKLPSALGRNPECH